jgi:hypothetical protein
VPNQNAATPSYIPDGSRDDQWRSGSLACPKRPLAPSGDPGALRDEPERQRLDCVARVAELALVPR